MMTGAIGTGRTGRAVATAALLAAMAGASMSIATPAQAQGLPGGCAAFGQNVATLGTMLGPEFGATASGVATLGPRAFPTLVVGPEQGSLCS